MGTVRITQERARAYKNRAMELFDKANPHPDFTPEEKANIAERIQRHPMQLHMAAFHSDMCNEFGVDIHGDQDSRHNRMPFNIKFNRMEIENFYCRASVDDSKVFIDFTTPFTIYAGSDGYWGNDHKMDFIPNLFTSDPLTVLELQRSIRRVELERKEQGNKRNLYESNIKKALTHANTLGQLIKMWPQAKELATQDELQKLHTKETRVQKAKRIKEEIELDVDMLNTEVLTANLLGD